MELHQRLHPLVLLVGNGSTVIAGTCKELSITMALLKVVGQFHVALLLDILVILGAALVIMPMGTQELSVM